MSRPAWQLERQHVNYYVRKLTSGGIEQPRMFVGSLGGDIIGGGGCCLLPIAWRNCCWRSVCTVAVRRRVLNSPLNPGVGNNPIGIFYDASRAVHHRRRGNKGASSPAP